MATPRALITPSFCTLMKKLARFSIVFALGAASFAAEVDQSPTRRPNIILILADDFGYECVGANGGKSYKTPALDRLASQGVRFEHCYAQPLCTPTRVQLMTGMYNVRNYVRFGYMDPGAVTFAQLLRKAGYRTCIAGKWQLEGGAGAPAHFGFDEHLLWHLTAQTPRYANPTLEKDGRQIEHHDGEYGPDIVSDFVRDFIRRNKDGPFLVYYPMILTHPPFEPTPASADWDPKGRRAPGGRLDPKCFPDMVAHLDKLVGKISDLLDELGLAERTLLLFTSDNGTVKGISSRLGDREVKGGKGEMTDAGTRVPLIATWRGVFPAGKVSTDLVDSTDFFPTMLEAAGVPLPGGLQTDGRSFLPQLRGEKGRPRQWIYSWFSEDGGSEGRELARTERFKLYNDGRLFDVLLDPEEAKDLSKEKLAPETAIIRDHLARVLDSFQGAREARSKPPQRQGNPEGAAKRIEGLGGQVFRKDGRVVEVVLNRRAVGNDALRLAAELVDLTDLSLEETEVGDAGAEHISSLPRLEWLNLYRTRIGDAGLAHLSRLKSLKHLPIGATRVTDAGLAHLARMTQLEYLGLRDDRITDAGLVHVEKLTRLKGLHLGGTAITDAGVARLVGLSKLEKLWLDDTAITDAAVEHLARLRSLGELHVARTKLSERGLEALRAALPGCEIETGP